jgi:hypothetical protein
MAARRKHRHVHKRESRKAARGEQRAYAALEFGNAARQSMNGRRAVDAISVSIRLDIPPADGGLAIGKDNRRGALHGNTQRPEASGDFGAAMNELGLPVLGHPRTCSPPAAIDPPPTDPIYRSAVLVWRDGGQAACNYMRNYNCGCAVVRKYGFTVL